MALDVILNRYASGDSGDTQSNTEKEEQENEMRKVKLDKVSQKCESTLLCA